MNPEKIGTNDINIIRKLKEEGKLLEAFFSITITIQWYLWANFHNKFHENWGKDSKIPKRDVNKLWQEFTERVKDFYPLIALSYSTNLIDQDDFNTLEKLRKLRNRIAHKLVYHTAKEGGFVTKKEVEEGIEEGINIVLKLSEIQHEIVFGRR